MNRTLSVNGLTQDAASVFVSMMGIINGRCTVTWQNTDPQQADVLLVAAHDPLRGDSLRSGKPCILVYPSSANAPNARFTLSQPFRALQMIKVLEDVARALPH
ncbi:MAG: hypothetical protein MI745_02510 [Pseudomonadales bacterium]|nr:hypothetical protein [Pseudomonadales bacterium]